MPDAPGFAVEDFAFIGRTFEEYRHMFDLDVDDLRGDRVLDCPAGPGSFVAVARDREIDAVGADVLYGRSPPQLRRQCEEDTEDMIAQLRRNTDLFSWEFYGDAAGRAAMLREACETFADDYQRDAAGGHDRYLHAELPELPFETGTFSLVLSGHFLFLYGDRLDHEFHLASLRELARVASREVRVFPLIGIDIEPYGRLDDLVAALHADGYATEIRDVPFEFQRGASEMLVIET